MEVGSNVLGCALVAKGDRTWGTQGTQGTQGTHRGHRGHTGDTEKKDGEREDLVRIVCE